MPLRVGLGRQLFCIIASAVAASSLKRLSRSGRTSISCGSRSEVRRSSCRMISRSRALWSEIEAAETPVDLLQIDITAGWPG